MNAKLIDQVFRVLFIFAFLLGTIGAPGTRASAQSLIGSPEHPIRIVFLPTADPQVIQTRGQIMVNALQQETHLSFSVVIPSTPADAVREICASPDDTMGFVMSVGYVLANDLCGASISLKSVRDGWGNYWAEVLVPRDSAIDSLDDLNGLSWAFPDDQSASGYQAPMVMWNRAGITSGTQVEAGNHPAAIRALYNSEVDLATTYFAPPIKPEGEPAWQVGDAPDIPDELIDGCAVSEDGSMLQCGGWQVMDARAMVRAEAPDVIQQLRILAISDPIPNDGIAFSASFPSDLRTQIEAALVAMVGTESWNESIGNPELYGWQGLMPATDADYSFVREMVTVNGLTLDNWGGPTSGTISGVVYQADGTTPIENIDVTWVASDDSLARGTCTDAYGYFNIENIPFDVDGYVRASSSGEENDCGGPEDYVNEYWDGKLAGPVADLLRLTSDTPSIDWLVFTLEHGGRISGTVYEADGVTPVPNIHIIPGDLNINASPASPTCSDANGHYVIENVPFGEPLILETGFHEFCNGPAGLYRYEAYDNKPTSDERTIFTLDPDHPSLENADFTLERLYPKFDVSLDDGHVRASNWSENATVTLTVEDPSTPESPDLTAMGETGVTDWDPNGYSVDFNFWTNFYFKSGQIVTLSDGFNVKSQVVAALAITSISPATDTVTGTAEPGTYVEVASKTDKAILRHALADAEGHWSTDFSQPGAEPDEQVIWDITPDSELHIWQTDEDGDTTTTYRRGPSPYLIAWPSNLDSWGWRPNTSVQLTVDDPSTGPGVDYSATLDPGDGERLYYYWSWLGLEQLKPGFHVTLDGGSGVVRELTIASLAFTTADHEADTVGGTTTPGAVVDIWACGSNGCGTRHETADGEGNWLANFATPGDAPDEQEVIDLQRGNSGTATTRDEDGDSTGIVWSVPNPQFGITLPDFLQSYGWLPNASVQLSIDDPSNGTDSDYSTTLTTNQGGQIFYWLEGGLSFQPGFLVTLDGGGGFIKELRVADLMVTGADAETDTIHGTGDAGAVINVMPNYYGARHEVVNAQGNWIADFSTPGEDGDEQDVFDVQAETSGYATQLDEDGDFTQIEWRVPAPWIQLRLADQMLDAQGWLLNTSVVVSVDDPGTGENPDFSTTVPVQSSGSVWYSFRENFELQPGFMIRLDGGYGLVREMVVPSLAVTGMDLEADTIDGLGDPGAVVNIWACGDPFCTYRHETVDAEGHWKANFAVPGNEPDEQETTDLLIASGMDFTVRDEDGDSAIIWMYPPSSRFNVHVEDNWIEGRYWEPSVPVNIAIDDLVTPMNPDFTGTAVPGTVEWNSDATYFFVSLEGAFEMKAGFLVTVSQGWVVKRHRVTDVAVTDFDPDEDIVSGTASTEIPVTVDMYCPDYVAIDAEPDSDGHWTADFTGLCDLQPGSQGGILQMDSDADSTGDYWRIPNPSFGVQVSWDHITGSDWWPNTPVQVSIDNPATGPGADFSITLNSDQRGNLSHNELWRYIDLQPGFIVTVDDGHFTKAHVILNLPVTNADAATDTVRGTASPGSIVKASVCWGTGCATRHETADANGDWAANFAVPGDEPDEGGTFDLQPGSGGEVSQRDADGDYTSVEWHVRKPIISGVTASNNQINGNEWPANASVQVSIDDPSTPENPDVVTSRNTDANGNFSFQAQYDILVGFTVSATDGITTKQVTVSNFEVTAIDIAADTISGTGTPNASAAIWLPNWWESFIIDPTGHWQVNLAGKTDIKPEDQGFAIEQDSDGDGTQFNWRLPTFTVQTVARQVYSYGWRLGTLVTLSVDDPDIPGSPDYTATQPVTPAWDLSQTYVMFDLTGGIVLEPGTVVTLTDGIMTKTHTIMDLAVRGTDLEADTVFGTAAPGTAVTVGHLGCEQNACTWRHVTADGSGNWVADFSVPGAGSDEQGLFDIIPGTGSWASQRDEDGDETSIYWNSPSIQAAIDRPGHNVEGENWPLGSSVTLTVDNPSNGSGIDYTEVQISEPNEWGGGQVRYELGDFRLETGAVVILTDGTTTRTHTVTYMDITGIDAETDHIFGKAAPGTTVQVSFHTEGGNIIRNIVADQAGNWAADFSAPGSGNDEQTTLDIQPGMGFSAIQYGDGNNRTRLYWMVPSYRVIAYPEEDVIAATEFWPGTTVTITVDDPENGVGVDLMRTGVVDTEPGGWDCQTGRGYCFVLDLWGEFDVQPGQLITITDGTHTASHVVTTLSITNVDFAGSTVSGTAEPSSEINLSLWPSCGDRHLFADGDGIWLEDFSIPGDEDFEQETCDFRTDELRDITAYQASGDGETWVGWYIPNPFFWVWPKNGAFIQTVDWPLGVEVTLTIDDPATEQNPDYGPLTQITRIDPWHGSQVYARFEFDFDIPAGHVISITDGVTTKTHTVRNLEITGIDPDTDIVTGTATPNSRVQVWGDYTDNQEVTADSSGIWSMDFSNIYDISPDSWMQASESDDDHDFTVDGRAARDTDGDGTTDFFDPCPDDATDTCDQAGSAVDLFSVGGGVLAAANGKVTMTIPDGSLEHDLILSITDMGSGYELASDQGAMMVVHSYSIQPNGTQFDPPAAITFRWDDADNDGVVDGTTVQEVDVLLVKDGIVVTSPCGTNPGCNTTANELTLEVSSLSLFAIAAPANQPPVIDELTAPIVPVQIGTSITATVTFSDPEGGDTYIVEWNWGDASGEATPATPPNASASHIYSAPGVYTVSVTITDGAGGSETEYFQYVVIFDPNGGYVTGGGWINSPLGAYTPEPTLTGKATFGFVSKYQKGANVPTGNTEFKFHVADLNFKSTSYDWLVIAGTRAQYKGSGTINGTGNYGFLLTAMDGTPDKFRIKIWDKVTGTVIYDNMLGAADTSDPTTSIEGGSIVIHKAK